MIILQNIPDTYFGILKMISTYNWFIYLHGIYFLTENIFEKYMVFTFFTYLINIILYLGISFVGEVKKKRNCHFILVMKFSFFYFQNFLEAFNIYFATLRTAWLWLYIIFELWIWLYGIFLNNILTICYLPTYY